MGRALPSRLHPATSRRHWRSASGLSLDLLDGSGHQLVHHAADFRHAPGVSSRFQAASHLAYHVLVAGFLEIGCDDAPGIGLGLRARFAEPLGGPEPEELVAPSRGPEAQFLVESELPLESVLAVLEGLRNALLPRLIMKGHDDMGLKPWPSHKARAPRGCPEASRPEREGGIPSAPHWRFRSRRGLRPLLRPAEDGRLTGSALSPGPRAS